jgi:hypothetical protein
MIKLQNSYIHLHTLANSLMEMDEFLLAFAELNSLTEQESEQAGNRAAERIE